MVLLIIKKYTEVVAAFFRFGSSNTTSSDGSIEFYLTVYGGLAGANALFTIFRAFLFAYGGICAATVIHKRLLSAVLKVRALSRFVGKQFFFILAEACWN